VYAAGVCGMNFVEQIDRAACTCCTTGTRVQWIDVVERLRVLRDLQFECVIMSLARAMYLQSFDIKHLNIHGDLSRHHMQLSSLHAARMALLTAAPASGSSCGCTQPPQHCFSEWQQRLPLCSQQAGQRLANQLATATSQAPHRAVRTVEVAQQASTAPPQQIHSILPAGHAPSRPGRQAMHF
jgi:hypothetical protein